MEAALCLAAKKEKLTTRSSTEAEPVGVDYFLTKVLLARHFLADQDIILKQNLLGQDNKSAILLEENGRRSARK